MVLNKQPLKVGFISLGCPKNLVDSEIMATNIFRAGFKLAQTPEKSDILIVNTCAFIRDAKREAIDAILGACEMKRKGGPAFIIVAGCLPQRYKIELKELFPEIDAFIGVDQIKSVTSIVKKLYQGTKDIFAVSPLPGSIINPPAGRILFTEAPCAYIKIAEGCNHHCAFCAIPQIRGKYRSRSVNSILKEAEDLLNRGVRELNLIAQDVTAYGRDLDGKVNLAFLLRELGRIGGRFWIRLLYGHPQHITDDLIIAMTETRQVCHYLDLPVQHCDQWILRRMGRNGSEDKLRALVCRIRKFLPDISLRTTCLVGFPGETDKAFNRLLDFVGKIKFDHLAVFTYSPEEGTKAALFPDKISRQTAVQRRDLLIRCQQKIVGEKLAGRIGETDEILIEKRKPNAQYIWQARSRRQAPEVDSAVYLKDYSGRCSPGMLVKARYIKSAGYDLVAEIEDHSAFRERLRQ